MSAVFETLLTELRALVVATWTDVPTGGAWENENLMLIPWDDVTLPVGNIMVPEMPITEEYGTANTVHEGPVTLSWIGATSGDGSTQRTKAEGMRDALLAASFTSAQVIDVLSVDWSDDVPVNAAFLERGVMVRAGIVKVNVIVGYSP